MGVESTVLDSPVTGTRTSDRKELERELIKSMAGCYTVTFKFAETFAPDKDYKYFPRKFETAKEFVFILEESENKISLQHLLFVSKKMVIKHWRQDWIYENRELLDYVKDHEWVKKEISEEEARGTWTQKVFQVDDSPRYDGYGTWVHVDGRHFWQSTTDAPLPRRDITIRDDYNVLKRNSHIELFPDGSWVLEQDNDKIMRTDGSADQLLCMEKGLETFTLEQYDPSAAEDWWEKHNPFWEEVRQTWAKIFDTQDRLKIEVVVDNELMYMALFTLAGEFAGDKFDAAKARAAIDEVFKTHVEGYAG